MKRREFLRATSAVGLASPILLHARTEIPKRLYKDGVKLSTIGFGGIIVMGQEQAHANQVVAEAVERGVNYFDVAPSYGNGEAEEKLGIALEPHRKGVFLACKAEKRDRDGARTQLETSLKRLKTDHFDLYQFHAVGTVEQAKQILAPGGAAETFVKAKKDGLVRYIGFSAHGVDAAKLLMESMPLDSVLFPVNYINYAEGDFGPQILAEAKKRGLARMALKAMAKTTWKPGEEKIYPNCWYRPIEDPAQAEKALRFTLSEDVTSAIPPGYEKFLQMALQIASKFSPLSAGERQALLASAQGVTPIFKRESGAAA
ncbi:MAG TPA: aldo/keto reductase [Edaphobacter sp.]|nr:aldo/keto reductase [Edaphobacter sp.]